MSTRIITDSAADLPATLAAELHITVVPAIVRFGMDSFEDRVDLSAAQFYQRLAASDTLPQTSAPAPGRFTVEYERLIDDGHDVAVVTVIGGMSGIYNAARVAAQDYPDRVRVVDSTNLSLAEGWIAVAAARAARDGANLAEVAALAEGLAPRVHLWAVLDTLEYAYRGGRLNAAQAWVGGLLQIKPILDIYDSTVVLGERVRTLHKAVTRLLQIVAEAGPPQEIGVIHAAAPELGAEVQRRLQASYPERDIVLVETGPAVGVHAGPGAVGVASLLAA